MNDIIVRTGRIPKIDIVSSRGWFAVNRPSDERDAAVMERFLPPVTPGYKRTDVSVMEDYADRCIVWRVIEERITAPVASPVPDPSRPRRKIIRPLA